MGVKAGITPVVAKFKNEGMIVHEKAHISIDRAVSVAPGDSGNGGICH